MILDSVHAPIIPLPYGGFHNQQPVSGWPMMTTPFETSSQYGHTFVSYENYPGIYASPEKPSHGYATPHSYGNHPQTLISTEQYSTTHGYNIHSPTPSTHQVHGKPQCQNGSHQNQHGGHQGYGGNPNQYGGHYGYNGHQNQHGGHHAYGQAYGHTGSWPGDYENNCTAYYAKKGIVD